MRAATTTRRLALGCALTGMLAIPAAPAEAYLQFTIRSGTDLRAVRWNRAPVRYFVTDRGIEGIGRAQLQEAVARAFETWQRVPSAGISFEFAGFVSAPPFDEDSLTTVGFLDRPDLERVLGATAFTIDTVTGEIVEADIFFNAAFPWSVAVGGEVNRFDLESIALHEIGHLLGLGHSALGETELVAGGRRVIGAEAVMFPVAYARGSVVGRTLRADDIAGASDLYPDGTFLDTRGSVQGRVLKDGRGVFGAHVLAFSLETGKLIGGFTLNTSGEFLIAGLEPGPHVLRVEPLDDAEIGSFFENPTRVDTTFAVTFSPRVAFIHARGGATVEDIVVIPR